MGMMLVLSALALQAPPAPDKLEIGDTKLLIYDAVRGMTFRIRQDGRVELSVQEVEPGTGKKVSRNYAAAGAGEFQVKYPHLVARYDLARHLETAPGLTLDQFEEWWKQRRSRAGRPSPGPDAVPAETAPRPAAVPGGRELGVRVQDVGDLLREQLSLGENEGVLVTEVKPGSLAERSGLKAHDILLKIDGRTLTDRWEFRIEVLEALGRPAFELDLLRGGKPQSLRVKTAFRKDE